jgi:hypothetical protein
MATDLVEVSKFGVSADTFGATIERAQSEAAMELAIRRDPQGGDGHGNRGASENCTCLGN